MLDNFSSGGAGQQSNRRGRLLEIEDNIDFQIGKKHRMRTGLLLEAMWYRSDELRNGNGTWTFGGLDRSTSSGLATTYTQRVGTTLVDYSQYQAGWYVQDDYTPFKKLSLSFGLRYEVQSHLDDKWNFAPRVGFTLDARQVHRARRLRHLQRLVRVERLRADAAGQRRDAAGPRRAEPARIRTRPAALWRTRLPPSRYHGGAGPADAVSAPGVNWRRAHADRDAAADGELHDDARPEHVARRQRQRADHRRPRSRPARSRASATSPSSSRRAAPKSIG